jgi:DNA-binding MarR family transcriptional regulator
LTLHFYDVKAKIDSGVQVNFPVQDVGLQLGFTKSGATRIVNRMEKKGLQKIKSHADGVIIASAVIGGYLFNIFA